jgi:hypothetical protein
MIRLVCLVINVAVITIGVKTDHPKLIVIGAVALCFTVLALRMASKKH